MKQQKETLDSLKRAPKLLGRTVQSEQGGKRDMVDTFLSDLSNEITKAEKLELVLAVVGTMKAGKSTTINAIVGTEVLPNRSEAMTILPTAIRHKPGQTEPTLYFELNAPFNGLIAQLAGPYKRAVKALLKPGASAEKEVIPQDVLTLAEAFGTGQVKPMTNKYVGRDAIYYFLHRLNDLVRLAKAVQIPESPLNAYTQIDHFPVIEVEFSHLENIKGYGDGLFTLLDTPGPNEENSGDALRDVLKNQLNKASAILAVVDCTQRGNDADGELRVFLNDVIEQKADRFYVVVNKFDQLGANDSKDILKLREQISLQSFNGRVKQSQIFPVSSKQAYYANAALRTLAVEGTLPLELPWVQEFGKLAFGNEKMAARMLPDVKEARQGAEDLLEISQFSTLTKLVVEGSYQRAAFTSMHSAIDLVKDQSVQLEKNLNLRISAINQESGKLKILIDSMQQSREALDSANIALSKKAAAAGKKLQAMVKSINDETEKNVKAKLKEFFRTGKQQTGAARKQITPTESKVSIARDLAWPFPTPSVQETKKKGAKALPADGDAQLFDANDPRITFESKTEATQFAASVKASITTILRQSTTDTQKEFSSSIANLTDELQTEVTKKYLNPIACSVAARVKGTLGFDLKIDISHAVMPRSKALTLAGLDDDLVETQTTVVRSFRRREKSGLAGWFKRKVDVFDNGWGIEQVTHDKEHQSFVVDLTVIEKRIIKDIKDGFNDFMVTMNGQIDNIVMPEINNALQKLIAELDGYKGNFEQSIKDKSESKADQEKIGNQLKEMSAAQRLVNEDLSEIDKDLKKREAKVNRS